MNIPIHASSHYVRYRADRANASLFVTPSAVFHALISPNEVVSDRTCDPCCNSIATGVDKQFDSAYLRRIHEGTIGWSWLSPDHAGS